MSLLTALSIARQGLSVSQLGLQVTAQNVANVNTQGYKRQRLEQANRPFGLGVTVLSVDRMLDPFAERRLLGVTSDAARTDLTAQAYHEMEELFNEVANRGLDAEFDDFFKSIQDLTTRPSGVAERATLRSRGESIGHVFEFAYLQMEEQMRVQDVRIEQIVSEVNGILKTIADLNRQISASSQNLLGRNELLNNRGEWVRRLSELIPVSVIEDERGNFTLFVEQGMPLVSGADYYQLEARPDPTDDLKRDVYWVAPSGTAMDITDKMVNGAIGGAFRTRDEIVPEQMRRLDRLAAEFVLGFNEQHRAGTGLDGAGNRNFFETTPVYAHVAKGSQGGAGFTATAVVDETLLTLDAYEIRFTTAGTYDVVNVSTGATILSGAYVSGGAIAFDGISVTLSDVSGPPVAGDVFRVDTVTEAAKNVRISAAVSASLDAIAAGLTSASGDNRNALLLADLETAKVAASGTQSFRDMYHAMIVQLGVAASGENLEQESQEVLLTQTANMVESVSGVNIDEETTSLMAYQRAYQAAAKVISITDEMLATLIQMI
jgi:flagellar hook-associated protein 1 FlgK